MWLSSTAQPARLFLKTWPIKQVDLRLRHCGGFHRLSAPCVNLFSICILQHGSSGEIRNIFIRVIFDGEQSMHGLYEPQCQHVYVGKFMLAGCFARKSISLLAEVSTRFSLKVGHQLIFNIPWWFCTIRKGLQRRLCHLSRMDIYPGLLRDNMHTCWGFDYHAGIQYYG